MLLTPNGAVRFSNTDNLDLYSADLAPNLLALYQPLPTPDIIDITPSEAFEESLFLGLRLNEGISLFALRDQFGETTLQQIVPTIDELCEASLLHRGADRIALTDRGRAISNEVFSRLLLPELTCP